MLFKRISRSSPEVVFVVAKNVSGSTMTAGYHCVWDIGASSDGVRVTQASTADLNSYAGIADSDIADSDYGLIQVYGYRSSAQIFTSLGTSASGEVYAVINSEWGVTPQATPSAVAKAFGFMCAVVVSSSGASSAYNTTAAVFVRAL